MILFLKEDGNEHSEDANLNKCVFRQAIKRESMIQTYITAYHLTQ